jgi:sialate O-acetylesterase
MPVYRTFRLALFAAVLTAALALAHAEVRLPALVGDNMVLQQGMPLKVWGWADAGEKVTVTLCAQSAQATAGDQGKWLVTLQPLPAGGPFEMTIVGKNTLTLKNVMVGEVWVCSGQSNMAMTTAGVKNAPEEIAAANYPNIRLFTVARVTSQEHQPDTKSQWRACSPQTVGAFSAVGYFFGRDLHQELKVPIGLIDSSWGGTCAEAWTTVPTLQADADYSGIFASWERQIANYPAALEKYKADMEKYNADMEAWKAACEKAKAENQPLPAQPRRPYPPNGSESPNRPGNLYGGMIAPLVNYAIRGAIWYQGESNAGRAYMYRKLLPTMIGDWRKAWGQDFPFYIVQLANYMARKEQPGESAWAELREAQTLTAKQPNNGMAVIIDVGEEKDIHPKDKQTVGHRLALIALAQTYGQQIPYSGPEYDKMEIRGNEIVLSFRHTDGGLAARGDAGLKGFIIAGEDKKWVWANARIEGDKVIVSAAEVAAPVAVRYAWADNPEATLYNGADLPAVPFRTDDWPGLTINNK